MSKGFRISDDRVVVTEVGAEPGVLQLDKPNVTVHLDRDPNDPRLVEKTRLVSGPAVMMIGTERVKINVLKEIKDER